MKKLLFSLATASTLLLSGCDRKAETTTNTTATEAAATTAPDGNPAPTTPADTTRAPQAAAYECPMKCAGSASDQPGKCPVCGMDLVKNT